MCLTRQKIAAEHRPMPIPNETHANAYAGVPTRATGIGRRRAVDVQRRPYGSVARCCYRPRCSDGSGLSVARYFSPGHTAVVTCILHRRCVLKGTTHWMESRLSEVVRTDTERKACRPRRRVGPQSAAGGAESERFAPGGWATNKTGSCQRCGGRHVAIGRAGAGTPAHFCRV